MLQLTKLKEAVREIGKDGLCLAFSGGVDSALLLTVAAQCVDRLCAVTFSTALHPKCDTQEAVEFCKKLGVEHLVMEINEFSDDAIMMNAPDRCYHCKHHIFSKLSGYARDNGFGVIMDGTNADDLKEYRPGLKALAELSVRSPLAELGITKAEVRAMAGKLGVSVSQKPSSPCMATRLPYYTKITKESLHQIEAMEQYLRESYPLTDIRARLHSGLFRLEVRREEFGILLDHIDEIIQKAKELQADYVTLDLEGFRSGSMDINITGKGE